MGRRAAVLYTGVAMFAVLAALTARSVWIAWNERSGEAKAEAVFSLVGQRTPLRPTDAPGAMAWLRLELERFGAHLDADRARQYRSLASGGDRVPDELQRLLAEMGPAPPTPADEAHVTFGASQESQGTSLRRQRLLEFDGQTLVVTRRRMLDASAGADGRSSDRFLQFAAPLLVAGARGVERAMTQRSLPAVPGNRAPRPVRIYAVSEDGTLVSLPWQDPSLPAGAPARELALLAARPILPTFAPEEFFFRFEANGSGAARAAYSGFYLDLGGRGLVSTLLRPFSTPDGQHGVVALDLAFDIDWQVFAGTVEPPLSGAAIRVTDAGLASWPTLASALGRREETTLGMAVAELAARERQAGAVEMPAPLRHGLVEGLGAVAAFQVSDSTWLLMLFPKATPVFPAAAVVLLAGLLALLLFGFEFNRRRAEDARRKAERALGEKQNLLNSMQVPLVVVDPNTDAIVSSNRAAETIGIRAGTRFADLVWPDARARAHYQRMQVASPEPRRAYGVPVGIRDDQGTLVQRYAIVRSVAVTAPIEALAADERHRLGVLFVLEPKSDLALLADDIEDAAHRDERRRLAGLLSHGVDTLARVLEHCLSQRWADVGTREFAAWLADYLERRVAVSAWLLDHWDATPPLPQDSVVDREQAEATLTRFERIFQLVKEDRELRARLHWNNGTLSAPAPDGRVLDVEIDWPPSFEFTCPVRGGFGWFLGEILTNAVRHGAPATTPKVTIRCDRVRKEIHVRVVNRVDAGPTGHIRGEPYGGLAILRAMSRVFEWPDLTFERADEQFVSSWRVPASERATRGDAD